MIIYISILLFMSNLLLAMDDNEQLSQKLTQIIQNGTLQEFQELYPSFKAKLDDCTLKWSCCICKWHADAINDAELIYSNPFIASTVTNLENGIQAISENNRGEAIHDYIEQERNQYAHSNQKQDFEKAVSIVEAVRSSGTGPDGGSIKAILDRSQVLNDIEKMKQIQDEREKIRFIQAAIKEIYETEFEPKQEWQYAKESNVYYIEDRKRKNKSIDHDA